MKSFNLIFTLTFVLAQFTAAGNKVLPVLNFPIADITQNINQSGRTIDLTTTFGTEEIDDNIVRFTSQTSNGGRVMDFALFSSRTPLTRTNFLNYVTSNRYNHSTIHRSIPNFVIQGGGFYSETSGSYPTTPITTDPPVTNEPGISNTYSTISMAKNAGNPDSATSQWFVSLGDNSANLDNQNEGFTVFARVTKSTMSSAAAFGNPSLFPAWDATPPFSSAFGSLPLISSFNNTTTLADTDFILFETATTAPLPAGEAGELTTLTYSFTNSAPSVVTADINASNELVLTYPTDAAGLSQIKVSATDSVGNVVDDNFSIKVLQSYGLWRQTHFSAPDAANDAISSPVVDINNDGLTNLELYVHGLSVGDTHTEPVQPSNISPSSRPTFKYPIRNNLIGITTVLQKSNSLGISDSWVSVPYSVTARSSNGLTDTITIQANSSSTTANSFYRLMFTLAE